MFRKFIVKLFLLSLLAFSNSIYAQTLEELEATKNNCVSRGENSYWHEAEKICTNTFKYSEDDEIIHYVGGWSPQGAKGYGQLYVYSGKDGSLTDMYKGQFLESSFNGFGHFETRYLNDDGQLIISSMIGNWNDNTADGFFYIHKINSVTLKQYTSYGEYKSGVMQDTFVAVLPVGTFSIVYENGTKQNQKETKLLMDDTAYAWIQHKYFGNDTVYSGAPEAGMISVK